jgi:hypothetical protein
MNTLMYEHPITAQHIATLQKFGYTEIPTIEKQLMCNDKGRGLCRCNLGLILFKKTKFYFEDLF